MVLQNDSTETKSKLKTALILIKEIPVLGGGGGGGGASFIFIVSTQKVKTNILNCNYFLAVNTIV